MTSTSPTLYRQAQVIDHVISEIRRQIESGRQPSFLNALNKVVSKTKNQTEKEI